MKTLLLLFTLSLSVFAQTETCNLALNESPEIRGLKLGMSKENVQKIFPSLELKFMNSFYGAEVDKIKRFDGVQSLDFYLIPDSLENGNGNEKVYSISLRYKKEIVEWDSVTEFAENLSRTLKLPSNAWYFSQKTAKMQCKDFEIEIHESSYIRLRSTIYDKRVNEQKEQKKKDFKP